MSKLRGTTSDSDDDYDKGCGMSSAHSLASNTSHRGRRKLRKGAGTVSPAGSNARAARAAARAKNIPGNAQSPRDAVPTEVVTRLYKHGKLIRTVPAKSNPSKAACDGLIYSDDDEEDLNAVDDDEYIEKNFTSFPKPAAVSRNRVMGGPQRPDTSNMSAKQEMKELEKYQKIRRQYTDSRRKLLAKEIAEANLSSSPQRSQLIVYNGDQCPTIRLMMVVESHRLDRGQLFQCKETLMLRVAEEANLRNIKVSVIKSNYLSYIVGGHNFYVAANFRCESGWHVRVACCREHDETLSIPPNACYFDENKLRLPFRGKWVSYLIRNTIEDCPGASYRVMSEVLRNYVNPYAITNNILQDAREHAKADLFGKAEDNVKYAYALRDTLIAKGHSCELLFSTRRNLIRQIRVLVLKEELDRRERSKEPTLERGQPRVDYVNKWLIDHQIQLEKSLGLEDGPEVKFLTGILMATSTSKTVAPFLEDVIQADAAHMSFGKYTLFSAYAGSANGKMVGLGFGILFGNETYENWKTFWEFLVKTHPIVNLPSKTIITDQDKGSSRSMKEVLPEVGLFHCSFHRRQNILKMFGGGLGQTPLSPLWM